MPAGADPRRAGERVHKIAKQNQSTETLEEKGLLCCTIGRYFGSLPRNVNLSLDGASP